MACFVITAVERLSSVSDVVQQPKLPCYYTVISSSDDLIFGHLPTQWQQEIRSVELRVCPLQLFLIT